MPGREREFDTLFKQALDYVTAMGACQLHCVAGKVPPEQRPAAEMTFVRNLMRAADAAREKNITLLIEPINPRDRPDYFLTRAEQAADIIAKVERPKVRCRSSAAISSGALKSICHSWAMRGSRPFPRGMSPMKVR